MVYGIVICEKYKANYPFLNGNFKKEGSLINYLKNLTIIIVFVLNIYKMKVVHFAHQQKQMNIF